MEVADDTDLRAFAFFSASLHKLMPGVPFQQHRKLYLEAKRFGRLAMDDERNTQWANTLMPQADFLTDMDQPGIIASFHTGPYRLLCMWLAKLGLPITVVIAADVAQEQDALNVKAESQLTKNATAIDYEYLFADDPMILRKMVRALKGGRFLVFYVDGNMGVGKNSKSRNTVTIDFLAHQIRVRTGVAELARRTGAPIYPVLTYYDDACKPVFRRFDAIKPDEAGDSCRGLVTRWMEQLYGHLQNVIQRDAMQWEGWFYIHHDLVLDATARESGLFNHYLPFMVANRYFLLHKDSFNALPIPRTVYQILKARV